MAGRTTISHLPAFHPDGLVLHAETRRQRLGLAIGSQVVKLMGGRIEVDSAVRTGSTFTVTLRLPTVIAALVLLREYAETLVPPVSPPPLL